MLFSHHMDFLRKDKTSVIAFYNLQYFFFFFLTASNLKKILPWKKKKKKEAWKHVGSLSTGATVPLLPAVSSWPFSPLRQDGDGEGRQQLSSAVAAPSAVGDMEPPQPLI